MPKSKKRPQKARKRRRALPASPGKQMANAKPAAPAFEPDLQTTDIAVLKDQVRKLMSGRYFTAAADCFRRMTELEPQNAQFHNDLATAEAMNQMLPAARAAQAKAIELAPDVVKYKINMSKIMMMQKDFYSAKAILEEVQPLAEAKRASELAQLHELCVNELNKLFGNTYSQDYVSAKPAAQPVAANDSPNDPWAGQATREEAEQTETGVNQAQSDIIKGLDAIFDSAPAGGPSGSI